ncbi:MAG: hypothetical protein FWE31_01765 [Firmicutes bacterium]|nr:hypothetical protein [Bacillota bacterium]
MKILIKVICTIAGTLHWTEPFELDPWLINGNGIAVDDIKRLLCEMTPRATMENIELSSVQFTAEGFIDLTEKGTYSYVSASSLDEIPIPDRIMHIFSEVGLLDEIANLEQ